MKLQWKLAGLMALCQQMQRKVTYRELSEAAGLSTSTIYLMVNNQAKRADLETMEKILDFFSDRLGYTLQVTDLLDYERTNGGDH